MGTAGATTVTVCVQCGHRLDADATRCAACGHVIDRAGLPSQVVRRRHTAVVDAEGTAPVVPGAVAPVGRRLVALLLDQVAGGLLVVLGIVGWLGAGLATGPALLLAVLGLSALILAAQLVAEAVTGATLGGALTGIRTVGARTGLPGGLIAILVRDLVLAVGSLLAGVGAYVVAGSGAWDQSPARRGWHDKIAGTMVLLAWAVPGRDDRSHRTGDAARWPGSLPAPLPAQPGPPSAPTTPSAATTVSAPTTPSAPVSPSSALAPGSDEGPGADPQLVADPPGAAEASLVDRRAGDAQTQMLSAVPPPSAAPEPVPEPGPEPAPAGPPSSARLPDEVELTRLTVERKVELLPEAWLRLEFDTGEVIDVVGDGAIGRDPAHTSGRGAHHQVALEDPERALSRLHLLFGPEQGGALLWVSDPGSTNGTVLQDPTGAVAVLAPGVRAVIGAGWQLKLGDRTVRVSAIV
ncbi:MAG: RDD family protein [Actinobacteria bacterium]|nr:RDD family protein [Actinomycetota bacterium]MCG2803275.1 RDD family protein [Cellulomonas sp.]